MISSHLLSTSLIRSTVIDFIMVCLGDCIIEVLAYADDIEILAESKENLSEQTG
jgi:hypothetical protein